MNSSTERRAFTLIEVLIASTITLVIVAIAMQFAGNMSLEARRLEQQGDLAARTSIANSFLTSVTDGIGYGWDVPQTISGNASGSFGEANCTVSEVCAASTTLPFQICDPSTVTAKVCAAAATPSATADALRFFLPRDGVIEAVRITDRKTTGLPNDCGGTLSSSTTFVVKGINASDWATGDLVVASNGKHVSVFSVGAAFAAGVDPAAVRELTLNLGTVANLALDDGGATSSPACSAAASLKGAGIFRVRVGVLRLNQTARTLEYGDLVNTSGTFRFDAVLSDVDDFQVRLDLLRHTVDSTTDLITGSSLCSADSHTALTATAIAGCGAKPLNALAVNGDIVRLAGLRLGLILRSRGSVDVTSTFNGLFDRTAPIGTDRRMRRTVFLFAGLPNALL